MECFNVLPGSSASSCNGGRGWIDKEGGAILDDSDRRLSPAYEKSCNIFTCIIREFTLLASEGCGGDAGMVGTGGGGWFGQSGTTLP